MTKPLGTPDRTEAAPAAAAVPNVPAEIPFAPALPALRRDGWTAERQRGFIQALAETGCVSEAAATVGVSPRSAYRLRARPDGVGFDAAWRCAMEIASHRLLNVAFERAIHGTPRQLLYRGEVVGEERVPSDRLLVHLLRFYSRSRFQGTPHPRDTIANAHKALPRMVKGLSDSDAAADPAGARRGAA